MSDENRAYTPGDAVYTKTGKRRVQGGQTNTRTEARIGGLLIGSALIWAAYAARADYSTLLQIHTLPAGPIELCGIGILVWLHAKWRHSSQPR